MNTAVRTTLLILLALTGLHTLAGCASRAESRVLEIPAGQYPEAIIATREALRASGYTLERIDATRGEVTTDQRTVAGLATPLAAENRTITGLAADTLTNRPRTVRVRFRDAADPLAPPSPDAPVRAEVEAMVWKRVNPNWRVETETARGNRISRDFSELARGVSVGVPIQLRRDDDFSRVIAKRIAKRLAKASARTERDVEANAGATD